jgi:signal transduction histidine kinase
MSIGLAREKVSLRQLVERNAHIFELQAREAGIDLVTDLEDVPPITGDGTKLGWALSNLIGNALRYTPRGGSIRIALATAGRPVRLGARTAGRDPARAARAIFERLSRRATSRRGRPGPRDRARRGAGARRADLPRERASAAAAGSRSEFPALRSPGVMATVLRRGRRRRTSARPLA